MTSKEIKGLLKEAREAIKTKDYPVAIRKCKVRKTSKTVKDRNEYSLNLYLIHAFQEILKSDKKSGMAFILLGAAYQESNKVEAAMYLRSALECSDEFKLLALQGLSNCAKAEELPDILEQLLQLVPDKYLDYYAKLHGLINQLPDHSKLIKIFCIEIETEDQDRKYQALKHLLNVFMKNRDLAAKEYKDKFLECLEIGVQDKNHLYHIDIYRDYFKLLHEKGKLEELIKAAEEMTAVYANNVVPLEWICKVYIENETFAISEHLKANFGIYVERLLELNQNSVLGLMASGFVKFAIGDLASARDILVKGKLVNITVSCLF